MASDLVDRDTLGRMLRAARTIAGFERVADAAHAITEQTGVHFSDRTLYALERGEQSMSLEQFFAVLMTYPTPNGPFFYFKAYRPDLQKMLAAGGTYPMQIPDQEG